ncbi:Acriflavin resistance protein like protein, partial [Aduncisulcus paluster]
EIPILQLSVTGSSNLSTVSQAADDLKNAVESVSGIDSVSLRGETETIVQIVVNPAELEAYGVTVSSISQAIQSVNVGMPAGSADLDGQTFNVRIDEAFKSVEDVKNVLIKTGAGSLRLSDIADVNLIDDEGDTISRTYRKEEGPKTSPVVYMSVYRDNGADTIGPVNEILNIIEEGRGSLYPDDIQVIITSNFAEDVEDSLGTVMDSAISGLLVVVLVLFLFIDLREALIVSLIIPLSMLVSCTVMAQVGITLNSVSLMGFVIALGLLVDNAI